ncbi:hypothetical protein [Rothia aerolata]|uniref:Uncharacterized protein n=1 Tax=Rothia aerolata TaxID=1812262 RepID=A0A917IVD3_9MICC|nr:hypothetical protein [Rothia aerolata]GGH64729.1 hypothetical protein GCM10007359_17280 [Rothia aerolata]
MTADQTPGAPEENRLTDYSLWKEQDRQWAARFTYVLAFKTNLPAGKIETVVERTRSTTLDADLPAQKLFGDPDKAARLAAFQETSHEDRSETRILPVTEATSAALMQVGFLVFLMTWFVTDYGSWRVVHPYNLAFVAAMGLLMALGGTLVWSGISRGRLLAATVIGALALAGFVVLAFTLGPLMESPNQPSLPMFLGLLLGLALGGGGLLLAVAGGWASARQREDSRDWFTQLEGYLRGQHAFRAREARGVVRETRDHLVSLQDARGTAVDPETEFGPAAAFAQAYAGNSVQSIRRKGWLKQTFIALQFLIFVAVMLSLMWDSGWLGSIFWGVGILFFALRFRGQSRDNRRQVKQRLKEARDD